MLALLIAAVSAWSASRARFSTDLFDALPDDPSLRHYRVLLEQGGAQGPITVGFFVDGADRDGLIAAADRFVAQVLEDPQGAVDSAFCRPDAALAEELLNGITHRIPLHADAQRLQWLAAADDRALDSAVKAVRNALAAPGGEFDAERLLHDPFGLTQPLRDRLLAGAFGGSAALIDGVLFSPDSSMAVALLWPSAEGAADPERMMDVLNRSMDAVRSGGIKAAAFGAAPMAVANRSAIGADSIRTSAVALALVLLLLLWYYRDLRLMPVFLLPPLFGFVVGVGALAFLRGSVSGLAIGAGSALLGIALDYSFHFLTHLRHRRDVAATLREVTAPMLLGCITTVLAFGALSFASSRVLADLGVIAGFMLAGALFMVLLVLPHFVPAVRARKNISDEGAGSHAAAPPRAGRWIALPGIVIVTAGLLPFAGRVQQDADPERLSLIPADMRQVRDRMEGSRDRAVPVFITGVGGTQEEARQRLEVAIAAERSAGRAEGALPCDLDPSERTKRSKLKSWSDAFQADGADRLVKRIREAAVRNGFTSDAFNGFLQQIEGHGRHGPAHAGLRLPGEFIGSADGETLVAVRLMVPPVEVDAVSDRMTALDGVEVMHRGMLGAHVAQVIDEDLSGILWRTTAIVFLALLITYGRIELALLTFLPMALGWAWILGLCGLLDIRFDLVNIMVCTFIFGLGDDYCIFTTEGMLARHRTGTDHTRSFRSAVVLSAITTIIGTGALFLAAHPALRSIAALAVTGMAALLAVALTVQPVLFGLFIGDRADRGRQPFTLLSLLFSLFAFSYFLLGCILLSVAWALFMFVPAPKRIKQHWTRSIVRLFTGSLVYVMANVRKDIRSFAPLLKDRPAIVIANHASFIDILAMLMITPRAVMMTNRWVWNSPFFGRVVRYAGFLRSEDGTELNVERARELIAQGVSVIIFPEGTRSRDGSIGRFHKGAFHIAETIGAPIVPVLLHGFGEAMSKGDALLKNATITMRPLPPIAPGDPRFGAGARDRTKGIAAWFKSEYEALRRDRETPRYFHERLVRAFTYKGPVLEWHARIKARMDEGLHALLNQRIPPGARITDLGSGHGMVSLLLHWCSTERRIVAVERDRDKVAIARHAARHWPGITMQEGDALHAPISESDAIILKDVLHYLRPGEQQHLLQRCSQALAPGGAIYVRDGFRSGDERHARTRWTERIAVAIGFNKTNQPMQFISREEFEGMAAASGLRVEWAHAARRTSNELAILTSL
ncbi:MAG: 1-acyl-sn-glycerol-3-phosphate acyltransferase [Flavobacteriales bacterium]|nr:1-acyl-sn-glycerol-3-phosphate acyltransferase [Flavobacteriales bacterium]